MELKNNPKLAVAIPRARKTDTVLPITNYDMFCFDQTENIRTYPISMMTRFRYHLIPTLNTMISKMSAAGLIEKFQKESQSLNRNENSLLNEKKDVQEKLTLAHVQGAFYMGFIGLGLAFVVFILEWVAYLIANRWENKFFKKYVERFICFS